MLTGESWSEMVARPLIFGEDKDSQPAWFSALFFASFILLTQIVLVNVVVAVLLDQFVDDSDKPDAKETVRRTRARARALALALTLTLTLTSFRSRSTSSARSSTRSSRRSPHTSRRSQSTCPNWI